MPSADVPIDDLLAMLGYRDSVAKRDARAALEAAGLTNARKARIAASKVDSVKHLLAAKFVLICSRATCREAEAGADRIMLHATRPADCIVCRGSPNQTAIDRAVDALARRGWRRVVVVGGPPGTREELGELVGARIELRLVSGTERRTSRDAKADLAWADVIVVWGSTELDHTVSKHYTDARDGRVVTCPKRGIAALAATVIEATVMDAPSQRP